MTLGSSIVCFLCKRNKKTIRISIVTWASLHGQCTVTMGWNTRCGTDEFSDGTRRQLRTVWRLHIHADYHRQAAVTRKAWSLMVDSWVWVTFCEELWTTLTLQCSWLWLFVQTSAWRYSRPAPERSSLCPTKVLCLWLSRWASVVCRRRPHLRQRSEVQLLLLYLLLPCDMLSLYVRVQIDFQVLYRMQPNNNPLQYLL